VKKIHQEGKNYPGYENSEEGKEREEKIARLEKWINSHEEQLSELNCLKNSTCNSKDEGTTMR